MIRRRESGPQPMPGTGAAASRADPLRVVIVSPNASTRFGGESILPWNYFRLLLARGIDVHLVTHRRVRDELRALLPEAAARMHFTVDRRASRIIGAIGRPLPRQINEMMIWPLMGLIGGVDQVRQVRALTRGHLRCVVHEPAPVSPRQPSLMASVGAPVVIGPLNGGMRYPDAFTRQVRWYETIVRAGMRLASGLANAILAGKRKARLVIVANDRTRRALPAGIDPARIVTLVENGVDGQIFASDRTTDGANGAAAFVYIGRLVDWKMIDIAVAAMAQLPTRYTLEIVGDGPMLDALRGQVAAAGLDTRVTFRGLLSQPECAAVLARSTALVLPSIYECGGAVVLEAMTMARPVIATRWGGPEDYVTDGADGILIAPDGRDAMIQGFVHAMRTLGDDPDRARAMGIAGRRKAVATFDWAGKIDALLALYDRALTPADADR